MPYESLWDGEQIHSKQHEMERNHGNLRLGELTSHVFTYNISEICVLSAFGRLPNWGVKGFLKLQTRATTKLYSHAISTHVNSRL